MEGRIKGDQVGGAGFTKKEAGQVLLLFSGQQHRQSAAVQLINNYLAEPDSRRPYANAKHQPECRAECRILEWIRVMEESHIQPIPLLEYRSDSGGCQIASEGCETPGGALA